MKITQEKLKNKEGLISLRFNVYQDYYLDKLEEDLEKYNKEKETKYKISDIKEVEAGKWGAIYFTFKDGICFHVKTEENNGGDFFKRAEELII